MTPAALRAARVAAGLTQSEVAARVNRSGARICQLENGVDYNAAMADRVERAIAEIDRAVNCPTCGKRKEAK